MPTTAELIAARFHNDGQCFENALEQDLYEVCSQLAKDEDTDGFDKHRFTFADGSILTICGDGWDLGYPDCYCWQGAGHTDDCKELSQS